MDVVMEVMATSGATVEGTKAEVSWGGSSILTTLAEVERRVSQKSLSLNLAFRLTQTELLVGGCEF